MATNESTNSMPELPSVSGIEFRHCPGLPGYAVSDDGSVWSCVNFGYATPYKSLWEKISVHIYPSQPYVYVPLLKPLTGVHHLVLEAFIGPKPPKMEACHNNGNPHDNRLENLRWDTHTNNARDMLKHGTCFLAKGGENHPAAKISTRDVRLILELEDYLYQTEIAEIFKVHASTIHYILKRKRRKFAHERDDG